MIPVVMSVLERAVSMTKAAMSTVGSASVDRDAVVVVVVGGSCGGGVEGLWPKREANGMDRRAEDDVGAPRAPGRGGRGGFVAREGTGSAALNAETVNDGYDDSGG